VDGVGGWGESPTVGAATTTESTSTQHSPTTSSPATQCLLAERAQLQEELRRLRDGAQQDASKMAAALAQRSEALAKQAADLSELREALANGEAELKASQLELQLRSRQAAHEEGLTRDTLRQHEAALVRGCEGSTVMLHRYAPQDGMHTVDLNRPTDPIDQRASFQPNRHTTRLLSALT